MRDWSSDVCSSDLAEASEETLAGIENIGPITAGSIRTWFAHPHNTEMVKKLRRAGVRLEAEQSQGAPAEGPFTGLTFVITGTLSQPREDVKAWITALGGKVTDTVSQKTSYVIVGNDPGGTKFNKAQQLAIPMLDEAALQRMAESKP